MNTIFSRLLYMLEKNEETMLVTIIGEDGSSPRGTGSMMLVSRSGHILGTIGGGAVEKQSEDLSKKLIEEKTSLVKPFVLRPNPGEDIGMICGGDVDVYFQYIDPNESLWKEISSKVQECYDQKIPAWLVFHLNGDVPSLLSSDGNILAGNNSLQISNAMELLEEGCVRTEEYFSMSLPLGERALLFGGGHCTKALAPLLKTVGFRVTIMDNREEFVTREMHPTAERLICGDYSRIKDYIDFDENDYIVVMTNGHSFDYEVEAQAIQAPHAYLGVIGSKKKTAAVNAKLKALGISDEAIASVHAPIGTKIKAVTPEEIAVSIAGEMIMERAIKKEADSEASHACPMH